MQPMSEGINLDPQVLIAVQNERLAAAAIREAQLTAAVQQLTMQVMGLEQQLNPPVEVVADEFVEQEGEEGFKHEGDPMSAAVEEVDADPDTD